MVRPLVFLWPDEPGAINRWDEWMLGDDLLVAPVWKSGSRERSVWFPPGRWVNFWDRDQVVEGPTEQTIDVPLDELPLYIRDGSPLLSIDAPGLTPSALSRARRSPRSCPGGTRRTCRGREWRPDRC